MANSRRVLTVLIAVVVAMITALSSAAADTAPVKPSEDPFYAQPASFPQVAPGTVLDSRPTTIKGQLIPIPVSAWQVKYATRDSAGKPIADITTVILPRGLPPLGGRKLFSYQNAEDGLSTDCSPSYLLKTGKDVPVEVSPLTLPFLLLGHVVTIPDYEGPNSAWMAGKQSAQGVLDGIRAALHFAPLGLRPDTGVAMNGYSGGGFATLWANELQPSYAPDINLVGSAAGGSPGDIDQLARSNDGGKFSGLSIGATIGLNRGLPSMQLGSLLNAQGKDMFAKAGSMCSNDLFNTFMGHKFSEYTNVADPLASTQFQRTIAQNSLAQHAPKAPTLVWQSALDEVIPAEGMDKIVSKYCALGTPVTYDRSPVPEHEVFSLVDASPTNLWLINRLAGLLPTLNTCN